MNPELIMNIMSHSDPTKTRDEVLAFLARVTYETPEDPAFL